MLSSCVTHSTGKWVIDTPMNADLEQQVLKETKLSGAILVGLLLGSTGYAFGIIDAQQKGLRGDDAQLHALGVAMAWALIGAGVGWEKGRQTGDKIVSAALQRDYLNRLNQGARAFNQNAAQFNNTLRTRMIAVKSIRDAKEKRKIYKSMLGESTRKAKDLDSRIAKRTEALSNRGWSSNQKTTLKHELEELVRYRDKLEKTNQELKRAYDASVPL